MRRDVIIGIVFSVLFHLGFIYSEDIIHFKPKKEYAAVEKATTLVNIEMPKIEEEPEVVNNDAPTDVAAQVVEFAPPMQADVPSLVTVDSFVQQMQPPPPEGLKPNPGVLTIPAQRNVAGATKLTNVFNLADLDQQPLARNQPKPVYPFEMRRAGVTGEVTVGFIVNVNGEVQDAYAVRSTQREFESAAIQAVLKWRFRPGKKSGKAVNTRMQVPIVFSITED
jgi:protein TonB